MRILLLVLSPEDLHRVYYAICSDDVDVSSLTREGLYKRCRIESPCLEYRYLRLRDLCDRLILEKLLNNVKYIAVTNINYAFPNFFHILPKDKVEFTANSVILRLGNGKRRIIALPRGRIYDTPKFEITELEDSDAVNNNANSIIISIGSIRDIESNSRDKKHVSIVLSSSIVEKLDNLARKLNMARSDLLRLLTYLATNGIIDLEREGNRIRIRIGQHNSETPYKGAA